MILFILSYLGGVLTILSPCILPVLPFVFARADQPFLRSGLPLLLGMAITFSGIAMLAAVGGGWAVQANSYGRMVALVVVASFGLLLMFPALSERAMRPIVALGGRLSQSAGPRGGASSFATSLLLGGATGLLWAPCAGPVLGLVLTGAALQGAHLGTAVLLLAYAAGAATSLALALLVGGKVFAAMKRSIGVGEWVRRALGAVVLIAVAGIALGLDTGLLTRLSLNGTNHLEQALLDKFQPGRAAAPVAADGTLGVEGEFPPLTGATGWLNSAPLSPESLRGKVVLVDFWTYSCINCLRSLPHVQGWADTYKDQGLVVVGVHAPEFAFEKVPANVAKAVHDLGVTYPVALDANLTIWEAFHNQYWPAHYLIDAQGRIRYHSFGEGDYDKTEKAIQQLLAENGHKTTGTAAVTGTGISAAANMDAIGSPETYVGYGRGERFVSAGGYVGDEAHDYALPPLAKLNDWGLAGNWQVSQESAALKAPGGKIAFRFHARDLHLVLGPPVGGRPIRFRVTIDGAAPGNDHGIDTAPDGTGMVIDQRLYQLVRQKGALRDHSFQIEFLDQGVQAFAFTFG